ncbi:MAG TPA: hypothetical protein VFS32_03970 [Candidatus Limnocylindrales bacterium]|nr:hypothetical protein [Candidatus Limnocylindrales bacterium]
MTTASSGHDHGLAEDDARLAVLIDELRRMERRRLEATPGSSEYIEVLGFERTLVERIRDRIEGLDCGPYWGAVEPPAPRADR